MQASNNGKASTRKAEVCCCASISVERAGMRRRVHREKEGGIGDMTEAEELRGQLTCLPAQLTHSPALCVSRTSPAKSSLRSSVPAHKLDDRALSDLLAAILSPSTAAYQWRIADQTLRLRCAPRWPWRWTTTSREDGWWHNVSALLRLTRTTRTTHQDKGRSESGTLCLSRSFVSGLDGGRET